VSRRWRLLGFGSLDCHFPFINSSFVEFRSVTTKHSFARSFVFELEFIERRRHFGCPAGRHHARCHVWSLSRLLRPGPAHRRSGRSRKIMLLPRVQNVKAICISLIKTTSCTEQLKLRSAYSTGLVWMRPCPLGTGVPRTAPMQLYQNANKYYSYCQKAECARFKAQVANVAKVQLFFCVNDVAPFRGRYAN